MAHCHGEQMVRASSVTSSVWPESLATLKRTVSPRRLEQRIDEIYNFDRVGRYREGGNAGA